MHTFMLLHTSHNAKHFFDSEQFEKGNNKNKQTTKQQQKHTKMLHSHYTYVDLSMFAACWSYALSVCECCKSLNYV